ncbi:hypothetical protein [Deinococcus humi]|uniref:Carboxypeptidase regulatory-like domain-containing protein n=1 Tax=Deinococcus humi TaxID=662880 RepID=A0A7W8NFW0_9DEIO|nr:hypothetical protein [Deinococcus humi]MBB5364155.1 hypothetical protein [Deinococcus humi]GGO38718.1 hypothetical protein GCM10008949_45740 [Deinococcus humi]
MYAKNTLGSLLLFALLTGGTVTIPTALALPSTTAVAQSAVSGEWSGKLDWIDVKMTLNLQNTKVTGTFFLGTQPFALAGGTWDASTGRLSFHWTNSGRPVTVKGTIKNGAFQGTATIEDQTDPLVMKRTGAAPSAGSAPAPNQATPYVMSGVVKDEQGKPVAGAEVFADNTLYDNMNAIGRTDAHGRYSIDLPRQELGTWVPGAYVKRDYNGVNHEFRLYADDESPFSASRGAVRNFVWRLSGERGDGNMGKLVYIYITEGVSLSNVEVTLTPKGPLADGSVGRPITRRVPTGRIEDVPVGRYTATARLLRDGQAPLPLLVSPGQGGNYGPSATADFEKSNYSIIMEFTVKRGTAPAPSTTVPDAGGATARSISGTLRSDADLKGTAVILCEVKGGECDETTERQMTITTSGTSARYSFAQLTSGKTYFLYGWKDVDGSGRPNLGDLVGIFGAQYGVSNEPQPVTAPSATADFEVMTMK